jgi:membrane protein YdbS with pleckstrin-like domain
MVSAALADSGLWITCTEIHSFGGEACLQRRHLIFDCSFRCYSNANRNQSERPLRGPRNTRKMSGVSYDSSLAVGEQSVMVVHPHWKTLVRPIAVAFVVVAALLVGEVLIPASKAAGIERLVMAAVAIALLMWWLTYPLLRWRTTRYELTTRRMRIRDGIIARHGRDIPLSRITDVSFRKGLLDRLLGCGTLVVESAGEHGEIILTQIPHVEQVQSTLFQLVEEERLRVERDDRRTID